MSRAPRRSCRAGAGRFFFSIVVVGCAPGCMSQQLGFTTRRTINAWSDLHYQQVVDNLAKITSNPGLLPHLAVAGQGSVQVTDNGNSVMGLNFSPHVLGAGSLSLGGTRNVTGTWSLGTITSPEKIRSMQGVYLSAIRGRAAGDPAFDWFKVGGKRDVPREASYVGRFGDNFVWVMPEGIDRLSDLTLSIMDVATREDATAVTAMSDGSPRGADAPAGVSRRNFQVPPVGPVYTPGVH